MKKYSLGLLVSELLVSFLILDLITFAYALLSVINGSQYNNGINGFPDLLFITIFILVVYQPAIFLCNFITYILSIFIFKILKLKSRAFVFWISIILGMLIVTVAVLPYHKF